MHPFFVTSGEFNTDRLIAMMPGRALIFFAANEAPDDFPGLEPDVTERGITYFLGCLNSYD